MLIIVFILISAVPLAIGLQYLNNQAGQFSREQYINHLSALSSIAEKRVLTAVDRIKDSTALITSRTQLRISLLSWNQGNDGAHQKKISQIISDAKHGLSHLKEIYVYDDQGILIATTTPIPEHTKLDIKKASKPNISLTQFENEITVISRTPLILNHDIVGYMEIYFFANFITDLVKDRTGLGSTGEWLFATRHESGDALIAVPLKYEHDAAFNKRIPKNRLDAPITQALLGNETIMQNAPDYREKPVLASTRYIGELDWGLLAKIDEHEVSQHVSKNQTLIYISESVIVLFAILLGVVLAYFIAMPVERLSRHTAKVNRNNLSDPPQGSGWHEVKELTAHFGLMIKELREFNEDLQYKVDKRTRELRQANKKLENLATHDPLTGLFNRRKLDECFTQEFKRAKRYNHSLIVVMLDIDHFKSINDQYGHTVGDTVIQGIAHHLISITRSSDIVARWGGEEFCILLPECQSSTASALIERIRINIAELQFNSTDVNFSVTCSFGIAYLDEKVSTPEELLHNADVALMYAKKNGRNRVQEYTHAETNHT